MVKDVKPEDNDWFNIVLAVLSMFGLGATESKVRALNARKS